MAKRKAGVKEIIYELDNDDMELSSDDECKETKIGRFEDDTRKKINRNELNSENKESKSFTDIIDLDLVNDVPFDGLSPTRARNGGKISQSDKSQNTLNKNVDNSKKYTNDIQDSTTIFPNHNIAVDSPSNSDLGVVGCENKTPLVTVRFKDKQLAYKFKKQVKDFLIKLLKSQSNENVSLTGDSDVELDIWSEELEEDFSKDETAEEFDSVSNVDDSLFFVDTAPCNNAQKNIPKYSQTFSLISDVAEVDTSSPTTFHRGPTCFNCDGPHQIKDCPLPRNHNKIAANRKNMPARVGRYHVEDEQKYGHLVPGRISGNLRHALGLKRYELPLYIYRMRILGYPPGWLEEARISHSGITLFDSSGNATQDPEEEDGELCDAGSKDKFDIKKILDFPGFNVPASSRYIEEAQLYGLPQISERDSKMGMLQILAPNAMKAYKRKKLTFFPSTNNNSLHEGQAEMDLDSGDEIAEFPSMPPLPDEEPPPPPPPPPPPLPLSTPPPENIDNFEKVDVKSKNTKIKKESNSIEIDKHAVLEKKNVNHVKEDSNKSKQLINEIQANFVDNQVDLASSSDEGLEVIEVVHVPDIPVPKDHHINIDDDDDDDDKSQLSSGPNSPSLAALEDRKKRLLDALKGDGDSSIEMIVLDETFSDSTEGNENNSELKTETVLKDNDSSKTDQDETKQAEQCSIVDNLCFSIKDDRSDNIQDVEDITVETLDEVINIVENTSTADDELDKASVETVRNINREMSVEEKGEDNKSVIETDQGKHDGSPVTIEVSTPDSKTGNVKSSSYGTPVLNVASPYVKLPSEDKFSKNICDVLNFENLPNHIGKFKKISTMLKRVKSEVDRIQDS